MTDMSVTESRNNTGKNLAPANGDRRSQLLEAAALIFCEKGFHDTKVSDVVEAAGVAQGTFYLYFRNKREVLFRLVEDCCRGIIDKVTTSSEARHEIRTKEELRNNDLVFLKDLFLWLENDQRAARLILSEQAGIDPAIDQVLVELRTTLVDRVTSNLQIGMDLGYIRQLNNPLVVAEAIVGMIYHMAFERFVHGRGLNIALNELAAEIVDFQLDGVAEHIN